jgi:hypothetical protein
MTIITESLISECQSRRTICIDEVLKTALLKATEEIYILGIPLDFTIKDVKKITIHNIIIGLCEFKRKIPKESLLIFNKSEFSSQITVIIDEVIDKMELTRQEKTTNFFRNFKKYLKKNGYDYLVDVYLKQASNKLALFR